MAFLLGKGFTGFYHYGHPCFIREEYELVHSGQSELERLEDALGISFSDINVAMYYCLSHARYQLYRLESDEIDNELLNGRDPWIQFKDGWVHIVTGEYVPNSIRPNYDSYPCWKKEEPASRYFSSCSSIQMSGWIGIGALIFSFLAVIMGGKK